MPAGTCTGRVVVITGAGNGIGRAHALAFAAQGAKVVVNDLGGARDGAGSSAGPAQAVADEITEAGGEAVANTDDISSWAGAERLIRAAIEAFGGLDVVVNNAGMFQFAPLEGSTEEMIRRHFEANVYGTTFVTQAALPALRASRGAIINLSSAAGHKPVPGGSIYASTKAAVESLTRSWALELAPCGHPGQRDRSRPGRPPGFDKSEVPAADLPKVKESFREQVPLGRMGTSEEVARWVVALADPGATWVTGQVLSVDGGMSLT